MVADSRPGDARLRAVFQYFPDAILLTDSSGRCVDLNPAAVRLLGYSRDQISRLQIADLVVAGPPSAGAEAQQFLCDADWRGTCVLRCKDGTTVDVEVSAVTIPEPALERLFVLRDVTVRQQAERQLRLSLNHLETILGSVAEGITVQDVSGRFLYANDAAARLCDLPNAAALLAATPGQVEANFEILDENGARLSPEALPNQIALREHRPVEAVLRYRVSATHEERWSLVHAAPLDDPDYPPTMLINVFQDITALKQEEARAQYLARASGLLANTLDYERTLAQIAQLAVPALADWAAVDVLTPDGSIRRLATAHADPAKVRWADELTRRYPVRPDDPSGPARVIRTGEPEFYPTIPRELLDAAATDEELARIVEELQLTSSIVVPLQARGRTLGALTFVQAESGRHYSEADLRFAQDVAGRAALALDNAGLYRDALVALHVRDEFIASVSHDLRTPLTTIRGSAQLVARQLNRLHLAQTERAATSVANIDRAARRMERMIGALLDITRLQSGRPLDIDRQQIDLVSLVRELVSEHQRGAPGHRLVLRPARMEVKGVWDPARLERVVDNLLSNAIKYSPDGGTIDVSIDVERDADTGVEQAVLRVQDEGIGIPAADLPYIFERFHRASNVSTRTPGVGIGLAGARQIAELHGGSLSAESELGTGSRFTLRLPLEPEPTEEI